MLHSNPCLHVQGSTSLSSIRCCSLRPSMSKLLSSLDFLYEPAICSAVIRLTFSRKIYSNQQYNILDQPNNSNNHCNTHPACNSTKLCLPQVAHQCLMVCSVNISTWLNPISHYLEFLKISNNFWGKTYLQVVREIYSDLKLAWKTSQLSTQRERIIPQM